MSTDSIRAILEQRARALARPIADQRHEPGIEHLTFLLGAETVAVEIAQVRETCSSPSISVLPGAEPRIRGVTLWRGEPILVLDLGHLLGLEAPETPAWLIVLSGAAGHFAVGADALLGLRTIDLDRLRAGAAGEQAGRVRGVTEDAVIVLNAAELHSSP